VLVDARSVVMQVQEIEEQIAQQQQQGTQWSALKI
jgi:hypothetical protein